MKHSSHAAVISRLKRAEGHLRSVIAMMEAERPCLDVAQQLHAVEKAITGAKRTFIQDHIDHCLREDSSVGDAHNTIHELKTLAKYL